MNPYRIPLPAPVLVLLLLMVALSHARGQGADNLATRRRLAVHVHLMPGITTVGKITAALAAQTGVVITAADSLQHRKVMAQLDHLTASAALDALAELNDWVWYESEPNHIQLTRRKLRMAATPNNIAPLVQVAIPADIRAFMGLPRPETEEEFKPIEATSSQLFLRYIRAKGRPATAYGIAMADLLGTLNSADLQQHPLSYAKLTPEQQADLLTVLVFGALKDFDGVLFMGRQGSNELDPSNAEVMLHNGNLKIDIKPTDNTREAYGIEMTLPRTAFNQPKP